MNVRTIIACAPLLLVLLSQSVANAFVAPGAPAAFRQQSTALNVFGPDQALAIEKRKDPKKYEQTITGLMARNGLTRDQAEKRYGQFLVDPDGFALAAAQEQMREKGYKDWKERAIGESADPEATRKRIDEFQKVNSIKGTAIMLIGGGALLYFNAMNPYVPPGH